MLEPKVIHLAAACQQAVSRQQVALRHWVAAASQLPEVHSPVLVGRPPAFQAAFHPLDPLAAYTLVRRFLVRLAVQ